MGLDNGIGDEDRKRIAEQLSHVLADSYALYLKTHNFHWNVAGAHFHTLHNMFEEQYKELAEAVDEIAERIRTLGEPAPGSFSEFSRLTRIPEDNDGQISEKNMLQQLLGGHQTVAGSCDSAREIAAEAGDVGTEDLMVERMRVHEKTGWMLRAQAEQVG